MPARTKRRSPSATSRARSPAPAPRRPLALTDATEDVGDLFEEMLLETLARDDGRGWRAGPVVAMGIGRLAAGHLGWTATLSAPGAAAFGALHLVMVPGSSRQPPKEIPIAGGQWAEFDAVEHFAGPPRLLLLAQTRDAAQATNVRQLAHDLFAQLTAELVPERGRRPSRA